MKRRKIKLHKLARHLGVYYNRTLGWSPRRRSRAKDARYRLSGSYYRL